MRPKQAAEMIGCSQSRIYTMLKSGSIKAKRKRSVDNRHGYIYDISSEEVMKAKNDPNQRTTRGTHKKAR